ncbi:unnamed protein product [Orchesella dallaii]|uniref:Uncharacterized protein n=1 Tax=Orchesella dallaii TaxID=48710 RepID=A0ABP1RIV8_9HEXA
MVIQYAKPPIQNESSSSQFVEAKLDWRMGRCAASHGSAFTQWYPLNHDVIGDEDCLYLTVFTLMTHSDRGIPIGITGLTYFACMGRVMEVLIFRDIFTTKKCTGRRTAHMFLLQNGIIQNLINVGLKGSNFNYLQLKRRRLILNGGLAFGNFLLA